MDSSNERPKELTAEERRFILWSIARANSEKEPGPYINGIPVEPMGTIVPTSPNIPVTKRMKKKPQQYRYLLLSGSTKAGALCGGLIGLNVGLLLFISANNFVYGGFCLILATTSTAILGMIVARGYVLTRRTDLFHARLNWCRICPVLPTKK